MQLFYSLRVYRNMKFRNVLLIAGFIFATLFAFSKTALANSVSATSANWSGYVATNGSYTGVSGTFVMPELAYSATLAANATWVGIGGKQGSGDLIQAGVYEIANSDGATYQAWYELLPDDSIPIDLLVHPHDSISVAILQTSPDVWNIVITNNTTKKQFEKTVQYHSSLSSAEWIQERPLVNGSFSDLSGFTPVPFTGATAVQNGIRVGLTQTNAQQVNLINTSTNTALAVPSPIDATTGTSFTVFRTSATAATLPVPNESITSPFELHRTGRIIIPLITTPPGISWLIHY